MVAFGCYVFGTIFMLIYIAQFFTGREVNEHMFILGLLFYIVGRLHEKKDA